MDLPSDYVPPVVPGSGSTRTRNFYNFDRQPMQILRPDGQTVDFRYDDAGRMCKIITPSGETVYAYNEPGCNCSDTGKPSLAASLRRAG